MEQIEIYFYFYCIYYLKLPNFSMVAIIKKAGIFRLFFS